MHATGPAVSVLGVVGIASLLFSQVWVSEFGSFLLIAPVSVLLLLPTAAGVGAAVAAVNTARLPLPDPARAAAARAGWVISWTVGASLAANLGQLNGAQAGWEPVARNVLLFTALGLATVRIGYPHLVWVAPLVTTLACMLFGYPSGEPRYYWWAVVMKEEATVAQLVAAGLLYGAALLSYVVGASPRRRLARADL